MALMELMKPEVDKKVKEERNMMVQIVRALMAGKDNNTIIRELNCTLNQITQLWENEKMFDNDPQGKLFLGDFACQSMVEMF